MEDKLKRHQQLHYLQMVELLIDILLIITKPMIVLDKYRL